MLLSRGSEAVRSPVPSNHIGLVAFAPLLTKFLSPLKRRLLRSDRASEPYSLPTLVLLGLRPTTPVVSVSLDYIILYYRDSKPAILISWEVGPDGRDFHQFPWITTVSAGLGGSTTYYLVLTTLDSWLRYYSMVWYASCIVVHY